MKRRAFLVATSSLAVLAAFPRAAAAKQDALFPGLVKALRNFYKTGDDTEVEDGD